ncbi:MAG: dipeptide epimerase [Clostridia bacterium]|nr:dipeptide epimerase [Clostridia bacterium]
MKITGIEWGRVSIPLRTPFKTALRTVASVEDIIVKICTDTGDAGFGEAPPTGVITGDTAGAIVGAMEHHLAPSLLGRDVDDFESILLLTQRCVMHNTSAKAAVDMALWDLYGKLYRIPVYKLLGGARKHLITDLTISVNAPAVMARDAKIAVERGFDCLKVKVGVDPRLDVERLTAVRQAVPGNVTLRIDANQAWKPKEAVRILNDMQDRGLDIEFVEQPVAAGDLEGLKYVTQRSSVPVLADEAVFSPADALKILQMGAADLLNIKLMKCGGIYNALKIADVAELYGVECMIGCMLEGKVAVNAAAHLACARQVITRIDLDGPMLCAADPVRGGAAFQGKDIILSDAPGLGVTAVEGVQPIGCLGSC